MPHFSRSTGWARSLWLRRWTAFLIEDILSELQDRDFVDMKAKPCKGNPKALNLVNYRFASEIFRQTKSKPYAKRVPQPAISSPFTNNNRDPHHPVDVHCLENGIKVYEYIPLHRPQTIHGLTSHSQNAYSKNQTRGPQKPQSNPLCHCRRRRPRIHHPSPQARM